MVNAEAIEILENFMDASEPRIVMLPILNDIRILEEYLDLESRKLLNVNKTDFTGVEFNGFLSHHSDFNGANFENSKIMAGNGDYVFGFNPREVKNLDLSGTTLQFLSGPTNEIVLEYKTMKRLKYKRNLNKGRKSNWKWWVFATRIYR